MQNIDVRFNATSNFVKVEKDLEAVTAEAKMLGAVLQTASRAQLPAIVDPGRWKQASRAVHEASNEFRRAAASSGLFEARQIRATSEVENFTKALQKQKLSWGDMRKNWSIMKQVYTDQLRFQRMAAVYQGSDSAGRGITDVLIPKTAAAELDTARRKLGMFGNMAASAGTQIVNLGKNIQWSGRQLTVGFTYPLAMAGIAAGVMAYKVSDAFGSINKVYDFTSKAINNQTQMEKEQNDLRIKSMQMATDVAKQYGLTITKTLAVEQELAATGMTGDKLMDYTKQVQRISALGNIDPSQTTQMVVALGTAFRKTIKDGKDMNDTLNFMNAASNATSLSLQDIAEATPRAASGIAQLGGTAEQMTVLLVSMREAGVDAASGANALKSATTRIIKPVQAAIDFYDKYNISLEKLAKESGGNLFKYLELLGNEQQKINVINQKTGKTNEKQTALLRAQGVAAIFGTYQNNRLTASLVNMGDAYANVHNQTYKALELMNKTPEQLQKIADANQKAMMETPAARMRKAWAELQITLIDVGKPFLDMAAAALEVTNKVANFFNHMSDWKKKAILGAAALTALVGPAVMLVGLMMNLTGQFVKGIGTMAKFLGISTLVTEQEQAERLATEAAREAQQRQITTTESLTKELQVVAASLKKATEAAVGYTMGVNESLVEQGQVAEEVALTVQQAEEKKRAEMQATFEEQIALAKKSAEEYGQLATIVPPAYPNRTVEPVMQQVGTNEVTGAPVSVIDRVATAEAQRALDQKVAGERAAAKAIAEQEMKANALLVTQNKVKGAVTGTGIAMGVMSAAMAATLISSNHLVDSLAKWAMIGTMAVPAVQMLVSGGGNLVSVFGKAYAKARLATVEIGAVATATEVASAAATGFGAALDAALGPVGWIVLGITAVTAGIMAVVHEQSNIKKQQEEMVAKQRAANKAMVDSTALIAENMGKTARSYATITRSSTAVSVVSGNGPTGTTQKSYDFYKNTDEGKAALKDIDLTNTEKTIDLVNTKFIDLQVVGNLTAKQSADTLKGMLMAAGMAYSDAIDLVDKTYNRIGNLAKVNWAKPIRDQINALKDAAGGQLYEAQIKIDSTGVYNTMSDLDPSRIAALQDQADASANIFQQALASAASPKEAKAIIDQYMNAALGQWKIGFQGLMASTADGSDKMKALFAKYGVVNGKTFAAAFEHNADFKSAYDELSTSASGMNQQLQIQMQAAAKSGQLFESTTLKPLGDAAWYLAGAGDNVVEFLKAFKANAIGLNAKQSVDYLVSQNNEYKKYIKNLEYVRELRANGAPADSPEMMDAMKKLNSSAKDAAEVINTLNRRLGFKEGRTAAQAMANLLNHVKDTAKGADDAVKGINNSLDAMPTRKTVTIDIKQAGSIIQTAMSGVQEDMATSAMDKFNSGWDSRMAAAQAAQDAAQNSLEQRQQAAQDAFDARWEHRKDVLNKSYDQRIAAVQREIDAEKKADDIRQQLFEKEKARLQELADQMNTNIDFNTQLNTGQLDEAAKTLNNAQVTNANAEMDAEQKAAEARSQARIDALEKKNDRLEKQRDKEIKQLEKMEDRMRKHLERVQSARAAALQKQQDAEMASMQKQRDYEEAMLDQRLELFKSYTARNQKDLESWMKEVGLSYDDFGSDVKAKGEQWSTYFQQSLSDHIRQAGTEVMNDSIWEKVGKGIGEKLLKGLGFDSLADFNKFVKTGTRTTTDTQEHRHEGGVVGSGPGSRKGVPNTYKGLHPSEKMIVAQKGEYVINKKASEKHRDLLHKINTGQWGPNDWGGTGGLADAGTGGFNLDVSAGYDFAGLMTGVMASMFSKGVGQAFDNNYAVGENKAKAKNKIANHSGFTGPWKQGPGGAHRPISYPVTNYHGLEGGFYALDISAPIGTPTYAVGSGTVENIVTRGNEPRREIGGVTGQSVQDGYRSYGIHQILRLDSGGATIYAHLSKQLVPNGAHVLGGTRIGLSGNTGNVQSSYGNGAHLHFGSTPMSPYTFTSLRKGGTIKYDGTQAVLHEGERVLTAPLTRMLDAGIENFYRASQTMGRNRHQPLFTEEGPRWYKAAYKHNKDFAKSGPANWDRPYQTNLNDSDEKKFERWVKKNQVPFNVNARIADYDMRGFWKSTGGKGWKKGDHFPDTFKTPYDTSFSHESKYATKDNPFYWKGDRLIDRRNGQVVFASPKNRSANMVMPKVHRFGSINTGNMPTRNVMSAAFESIMNRNGNVASEGGDEYNVTIDLRGAYIKEDVDIERVVEKALDKREGRRGREKVIR